MYVIVSRRELIQSNYSTVVCAPVYSNHQGLATQVAVNDAEGLKRPSSIHCDNLASVTKADLRHFVGSLGIAKTAELDRALLTALDLFERDGP